MEKRKHCRLLGDHGTGDSGQHLTVLACGRITATYIMCCSRAAHRSYLVLTAKLH